MMPDETHANKEDSAACNRKNQRSSFWIGLLCWDAVLSFATIALAIYTYKLWHATNELLVDAQKTSGQQYETTLKSLALTEKTVDAATRGVITSQSLANSAASQVQAALIQANAVSQSNKIAIAAMMEANQPFIALKDSILINPYPFVVNSQWNVTPSIRNSGNAGASDVRASFGLHWVLAGHIGEYILTASTGSQMLIPRDNERAFPLHMSSNDMSTANITSFENGQIVIELLGRVDYSDAFNRHHIVKICQYFDRAFHSFVDCGQGNSATTDQTPPRK